MSARKSQKMGLRILRFLYERDSAQISLFNEDGNSRLILTAGSQGKLLCNQDDLDILHRAGLIGREEQRCWIVDTGKQRMKRALAADDPFLAQHRKHVKRSMTVDGQRQTVTINANESPLARLRNRRDKAGNPWLSEAAFQAGERFRADFTRGQLMQKVTASWDSAIGSAGKKSGAGDRAQLNDSALDARRRLEKAADALGPDLAGVLTDIVCFLKGLEAVERERRWPPRSAKLMLRTGLDLLARHYGTATGNRRSGRVETWTGEGYRPELTIR